MPKMNQTPQKILNLIGDFKDSLKKSFRTYQRQKNYKEISLSPTKYYEEAKKAETEQRNLWKALKLYIKAIKNQEKKDSTIKDFASSLHQLGNTRQAVNLMDDCEVYYDGNKDKYFRLRDNLQQQIKPTGKHQCRYLLIQNVSCELKMFQNQEALKDSLFKSTKRIKKIILLESLDLLKDSCSKEKANNILVEFQSFSAAKKTLQSFYFQEWFGSNTYWVNSNTMKIVCAASDGKNDFEEGLLVDQELIKAEISYLKENFWATFAEERYSDKRSNGFTNLLATHIIKQYLSQKQKAGDDKENIFESSKINQNDEHRKVRFQQEQKGKKYKFNNKIMINERNRHSYEGPNFSNYSKFYY